MDAHASDEKQAKLFPYPAEVNLPNPVYDDVKRCCAFTSCQESGLFLCVTAVVFQCEDDNLDSASGLFGGGDGESSCVCVRACMCVCARARAFARAHACARVCMCV